MTILGLSFTTHAFAAENFKIVATTATFANLTREVVGESAEIHTVAPPSRDIHFINPTPKDVLKTKKADVFVHGGLDLEAWRGPLLDASGRVDFINGTRAIDVSRGIPLLEIPTSLSRAQGDIHAFGNPHYWTDPENVKLIVSNIADGLAKIFPERSAEFQKNAEAFNARLDEKIRDWQIRLAPYRGTTVVTYHNSWPYFAKRFGFEIIGQLEPKPGIPPTAKHLAALITLMKEHHAKLIIRETFREKKAAKKVAAATGAKVAELLQQPGEKKEAVDYLAMMDYDVAALEAAL